MIFAMVIFFVFGVIFLVYGSFAISGEQFHNPIGTFLFLLVLLAFGLLCLIAIAEPIIKRLPKRFRNVIDDDMREDGDFDTAQHAIAICILKDNHLVQLKGEDGVYAIPTKIIEDSLHIESALKSFATSIGLPSEDLSLDKDYGAFLPEFKEAVECHVFRYMDPEHIPNENRLVDSSDVTALNPLEKQLVTDLKKEGVIA